jgi:hypothetical protein
LNKFLKGIKFVYIRQIILIILGMRKQLLLLLTLATSFAGIGQVLITSPDDLTTNLAGTTVVVEKPQTEYLVYSDMRIVNNSGSSVELKFRRIRTVAAGNNSMGSPIADQLCYGEECTNAANVTDYVWTTPITVANGENILFKPQIINIFEDVFEAVHVYEVMDATDNVLATITVELKTYSTASLAANQLDFSIISVYPNPAKEKVNINLPKNVKANIVITDALGKQVMMKESFAGGPLNISNLKNGVYFVSIHNHNLNLSETRKLIIRK